MYVELEYWMEIRMHNWGKEIAAEKKIIDFFFALIKIEIEINIPLIILPYSKIKGIYSLHLVK